MQAPRQSFLVSLLIAVLAVPIVAVGRAAFKAVFDVTVQDYWKDTAAPFLQSHVGPWSTAMLEWIGPYWTGVGSAFALMFVVEMVFAWRRRHRVAAEAQGTVEPPAAVNAPRAFVRLRFSGRNEPPQEIDRENIGTWFAYWSSETNFLIIDDKPAFTIPANWAIFLSFEKPVQYRQIGVNFTGQRPEFWQVRQHSPLSAVITIDSKIPECELEIITRV